MTAVSAPGPSTSDSLTAPGSRSSDEPRSRRAKSTIRYTLDLSRSQHRFLKLTALDAGVEASRIVRALLQLLEADPDMHARVDAIVNAVDADPDSADGPVTVPGSPAAEGTAPPNEDEPPF